MGHTSPPPPSLPPTLCAKTLGSSILETKMGAADAAATGLPLLTWDAGQARAAALDCPGLWVPWGLRLGRRIAFHSSQASLCWVSHHLSPHLLGSFFCIPHSLSLQTSILSPSLWRPLLQGSPPSFLLLSVPQFSLAPHLGSLPSYLTWDPFPWLSPASFSFRAPSDPLLGRGPALPQTSFPSLSETCPGRFS